jgi:FAD/FMN-containing dehydrogenase
MNLIWNDADVADADKLKAALQDRIYELAVVDFAGSYSAEHGVGPHNQRFYDRFTDPVVKALCRVLGDCCDPQGQLGTVRLG